MKKRNIVVSPLLLLLNASVALVAEEAPVVLPEAPLAAEAAAETETPAGVESTALELQAPEEEAEQVIRVVGTRVKQIDYETTTPTVIYDSEEISRTGYATLGDFVKNLPFNSGATITAEGSALLSAPGLNSFNFRGLGNNNTLVLINGRRAAPAGAGGFNGFQQVFDFNSVPNDMIESVQILKDGGSAIYGSDAVAGVIDIQLKENFDGVSTTTSYGDSTGDGDMSEKKFSVIMGRTEKNWSFIFQADIRQQNGSTLSEYPLSASTDQTANGGFDLRSTANWPANLTIGAQSFGVPGNQLISDPSLITGTVAPNVTNLYDPASEEDLMGEVLTGGFYARGKYEFNRQLYAFAETSYRYFTISQEAAPVPLRSYLENGDGPNGELNIPAENPYNPLGNAAAFGAGVDYNQDIGIFEGRLVELGNREISSDLQYFREVAGIGGEIRASSWSWEVAGTYSLSLSDFETKNMSIDQRVQEALNGTAPGLTGTYLNLFGSNDPDLIEYLRYDDQSDGSFQSAGLDMNASGEIFDLPAGPVQLAFGLELRNDLFKENRNAYQEAGQVIGGNELLSVNADRTVISGYFETLWQLTTTTELQLAGRIDHYSDFGFSATPKFGIKQRVGDNIILRASYGQSFLAPNLAYLEAPAVTTYTTPLLDPERPLDSPTSFKEVTGGNSDLDPETTETFYAGIQFEPGGAFEGLRLAADYFQFNREDLLNKPTAATIIANESLYPGAIERDAPSGGTPGKILAVNTQWQNVDSQTYRGIDVYGDYLCDLGSAGQLSFNVYVTYLMELELGSGDSTTDFAGEYGSPEWRGNAGVTYFYEDWMVSANMNYIGEYAHQFDTGTEPVIDEDIRYNLTVSYAGFWDSTISVSILNLTDEEPPFDDSSTAGYNRSVNSGQGRFFRVSLTKNW
ncbi:TonB-dependent receptor [Coraliomargarita sp. SDUM461003]|uniref:TonB-dependent receptor n=1 Tax=Thalassobacterium maritimum TaxID=3041265 RepID=A0ABU1AZN1_9BACT|nr:TonB-dependent receptor [Coraliomargarita sp. SDUM461003]MDQ8209583.1 TonB-dependent receptor [Coraliomargarita sp. SDUM461003]